MDIGSKFYRNIKRGCISPVNFLDLLEHTTSLLLMASSMRFERTTYCLGGSRSIQLSYEDVGNHE